MSVSGFPRGARSDEALTAGGRLRAAAVGVLAFPWFVHAAVVVLSALGLRPLVRGPATALLVSASVFATVLARWAAGAPSLPPASQPVHLPATARALTAFLSAGGLAAFAAPLVATIHLPIVAYDAIAYRLPVIAAWLDVGRVAWVQTDDQVRNGYPLGQEAVSAVVAAAAGSFRFAGATSFVYVAGGALGIWLLADHVGVRPALSRAAAAVFLLVPMVVLNAPSGYADAAFAGATVALLCSAAIFSERADPPRWSSVLVGMAVAHVLALKGTGVAIVAVAAIGVLARIGPALTGSMAPPLALSAALAAPGAFWLARNVVHTGNPLWPVELHVLGHTFRGVGSMAAVLDVEHNMPAEFRSIGEGARVIRSWLELGGPAHDFDQRTAGLGLAWPLVALPAAAFVVTGAVRKIARPGASNVVFVLVLTALCFAVQPLRWWPRYTIWVWGAGALALALSAEWLARAKKNELLGGGLLVLTALSLGEAAIAVAHASGVSRALGRSGLNLAALSDPRRALNAASWVRPGFWDLGLDHEGEVCRGAWKPVTDDANLDGVLAQLSPRPRVHVVPDDAGSWPQTRAGWQKTGCSALLLLRGSPVLAAAVADPDVTVEPAVAFDPLFVVRPRVVGGAEPARAGGPR